MVDEQGHETAESKNGLDLLKQLIDLSHITKTYDAQGNPVPVSSGDLQGHIPFENHADKPMRGGQYLEFFLRTNLDHTGTAWTPIANNENECFSGTLHGDGHTITGLDHSFINHLCGDVYNLGVTGTFTGAGVADTGDGYVENCWINTTGTPNGSVYAVFGNPTRSDANKPVQIANCYYQEGKSYTTTESVHGVATAKPDKAFYNGEVTYDLNGFYLNKRYYEGTGNNEPAIPVDAKLTSGSQYVTDRYKDGDFVYANGTIPDGADERLETDENGNPVLDGNGKLRYEPKWPTDYLFFGHSSDRR